MSLDDQFNRNKDELAKNLHGYSSSAFLICASTGNYLEKIDIGKPPKK